MPAIPNVFLVWQSILLDLQAFWFQPRHEELSHLQFLRNDRYLLPRHTQSYKVGIPKYNVVYLRAAIEIPLYFTINQLAMKGITSARFP